MKYLIVAVFLAIVQTPPPLPRQASDDHASQASKYQRKADPNQQDAISPSVPVNTPHHAPQGDGQSNPDGPANNQETIRVPELPPVTVNTDWWTKLYVCFTGCLVIIGAGGICAALKTL